MVATNSDITVTISREAYLKGGLPNQTLDWQTLTVQEWQSVLSAEIHSVASNLRYLGTPTTVEAMRNLISSPPSTAQFALHHAYPNAASTARVINFKQLISSRLAPSGRGGSGAVFIGENGDLFGVFYTGGAKSGFYFHIIELTYALQCEAIADDLNRRHDIGGMMLVPYFVMQLKELLEGLAKERLQRAQHSVEVVDSLGTSLSRVKLR